VVNRLLARFIGEVVNAIDEGTPFTVADSALAPVGLPMSPLMLLQLVGPATAQHVTETMHGAFPKRFSVSENLGRVVAAGKSAIYVTEGGRPKIDPEIVALFTVGERSSTAEQVRERALAGLAEEARLMLDEGVVAQAQDIDLCMITGAGWPFHMGGLTPYLDRSGIAEQVTGRRFLAPGVASVPAQ
jgi:3-hydroxyacyl-CoA dehydrogenase